MKHAEFMTGIKNYYGPFDNEFIEDMILKHILKIPENELNPLFNFLTRNIPRKKDFNPIDIEKLDMYFKKSDSDYEIEALSWYKEINKHSTRYDVY